MSRKPFIHHRGIVAPLLRDHVDTDAIIPSREMKRVSRKGLSEGLFAGWRYRDEEKRTPDPGFVLNQAQYKNASILATGDDFGCGSSREHAVWALAEYGFRVILAPSFAAIFERNCINNGLAPIRLEEQQIDALLAQTEADPQNSAVEIDLEKTTVVCPDGARIRFTLSEAARTLLIHGWEPIDLTLQCAESIDAFEREDRSKRPWAYT